MCDFDAALSVELKVGIEVIVAGRHRSGIAVTGNVLSVVGKPHAQGNAAAIIGRANVPGVRCVAHESGMVRAAEIGPKGSARSRIAVVCGNPQTSEGAGQEGKVLQIGNLEAVEPSTAGVERLA